jgi:hypothetical protein
MARDSGTIDVDALTPAQGKAEHARLEAELRKHDDAYYQRDAPTVSDAEYDALRRRYEAIEARFPDLRTLESLTRPRVTSCKTSIGGAPGPRLYDHRLIGTPIWPVSFLKVALFPKYWISTAKRRCKPWKESQMKCFSPNQSTIGLTLWLKKPRRRFPCSMPPTSPEVSKRPKSF